MTESWIITWLFSVRERSHVPRALDWRQPDEHSHQGWLSMYTLSFRIELCYSSELIFFKGWIFVSKKGWEEKWKKKGRFMQDVFLMKRFELRQTQGIVRNISMLKLFLIISQIFHAMFIEQTVTIYFSWWKSHS